MLVNVIVAALMAADLLNALSMVAAVMWLVRSRLIGCVGGRAGGWVAGWLGGWVGVGVGVGVVLVLVRCW